ncbi:MAG: PEP-CTERM sorting domain-containing protein [Massilia sp.]
MFATLKQPLPRTALLAGLALAVAPFAQAGIIYTDLSKSPLKIPNTFDGTYLNVVNGDNGKNPANVPGWDLNFYNDDTGLAFFSNTGSGIVAKGTQASALAAGTLISSASNFRGGVAAGDAFQVDATEYLGFSFKNESTGKTNYGWALLSTTFKNNNNAGFPAAILGYAFDDSGAGIRVAATSVVPEPGSFALFGLGALAMGAIARRRRTL